MKKLFALILAAVMLLSLVACNTNPNVENPSQGATQDTQVTAGTESLNVDSTIDASKTYKKHITMSTWSPLSDPDPHFGPRRAYYENMCYNQLVFMDADTGEFSAELATEWKMESPTSYWFKLRENVVFANGEPLTADDIVYSLYERPIQESGENRSPIVSVYKLIEKIEALNDLEVRITLKDPDVEFLYKLYDGGASIINRDACVQDPEKGFYVGTGGWITTDLIASDSVTMKKVETSWVWKEEGDIPTETVTIKYLPENSIASCQAGDVANALCSPSDINSYLKDDPNVETHLFASLAHIYVGFNCTENSIFHNDYKLRNAVAYAINRDEFNDFAADGTSHTCQSTWGEKQAGFFQDFEKPYGYDLEYAKQLLAESSQPNGCHIRFLSLQGRADQATLIAEMLKELGITCEIIPADSTAMKAYRAEATAYDMYLTDTTYSMNASAKQGWFVTSSKTAGTWYQSDKATELFKTITGGATEEERLEACKQMQILAKEESPYVPLIYMMTGVMWHKGVSGLYWSVDAKYDWHRVTWEES